MSEIKEEPTPCRSCGCEGNVLCGAKPETKELCTLDATGECYCCRVLGVEENKKRWKK